MQVSIHDSIGDIGAVEWDALAGDRYPFLNHAFLDAAESTGCVSPETGWTPCHLALGDDQGKLRAAMPLYLKDHSWGEFVFDWAWANAYERAGLSYYPKLVSAIPFTPATSTRILLANDDDEEAAMTLIDAAIGLVGEYGCSTLHVLFPTAMETRWLESRGLIIRRDCQFHWHNRNYDSFDDFLAGFTSSKRKKARRDRRRVHEAGIRFRHLHGDEMDDSAWEDVYRMISRTFMRRGSMPYFSLPFFREIGSSLGERLLVVLGEDETGPVSTAVFYVGPDILYGRYWGCEGFSNALHFETCYFQGIDYCIANDIAEFNPGTQGEHKISRGFLPVVTTSAHWIEDKACRDGIGRFIREESRYVDRYMRAVDQHSPFRRPDDS